MSDKSNQWYNNSYRRNLVDMHIEDWDDAFLSEFDPVVYCENLKKAKIKSAMIYFHSHVGYSYYPTRVGKIHKGLIGKEDAIKRLVDLCHKSGIDVIGYYSLIYNSYERARHPEWQIFKEYSEGTEYLKGSRYGLCCPNNPEYRAYVREQIKEISEYFTVDGIFYDMTFWPGKCKCPHCEMRFLNETGYSGIPTEEDWSGKKFLAFKQKREEWIGEFARFVTACSKEFMPHASVEHNYAYSACSDWNKASTEKISDACDYVGGDLHGSNPYRNSFAAKYWRSITKNPPFEYMISRCDDVLSVHTITKTEARLSLEMFLTAAHHGATFVIDAIDPIGTLDSRVYERIGRIFEKQIPYEKYFNGTPIEDIAIYYSPSGRYNRFGEDANTLNCSITMLRGAIMEHILTGVKSNSTSASLGKHKMVLAPAVAGLDDTCRANICDYVRNGGVFYFSGGEEPELLRELLGAEFENYSLSRYIYIAPANDGDPLFGEFTQKYPMPTKNTVPMLTAWRNDARIIGYVTLPYLDENDLTKFASIHSNPPSHIHTEAPAILEANYGKGRVVWCASPYEYDARTCYNEFTTRLIRRYISTEAQSVASNAPRQVEICGYRTDDGYQLNFVDLLCTDEQLTIRDFDVSVKLLDGESVESVSRMPNGEPIEYSFENGYVNFIVKSLVMYEMIGIKTHTCKDN